jgi:hypothetical protein
MCITMVQNSKIAQFKNFAPKAVRLSLQGTWEKNFSSHFKCYNLTIHALNFCKTFCHVLLVVWGKILQLKVQKSKKKFIWAS